MKEVSGPLSVGNFIAGKWDENGNCSEIYAPSTGAPIGKVYFASLEKIQPALVEATKAQIKWSETPLKERCQVMFRFREILLRDLDQISSVISLENGKLHSEAKAGLLKGIEVLEYALSLQNSDEGAKMEVSRGVFCEYRRQPVGVVCGITPFNFPAMVPLWMIPIAVTLGNAFVWKPSEKTPLTSKYIANSLDEAGVPKGVFTVIQGGKEVVELLLSADQIKAVAFVGSTNVAKLVYHKAAVNNKRVLALGGAKNHIFLLPDADQTLAITGITDSFTGCGGQRCMASSVLLAIGEVDHIIDKIVQKASQKVLGENMGALISQEQREFLISEIEMAQKQGAKILLDGTKFKAPVGKEKGFWLGPTILDQVQPGSRAATTELFGPVMSIIRCQNISQALQIENNNPYGNAASVFTTSGPLSERVVSQAQAGMVGVNVGVPVPREPFSFGGIGDSKFGHGDITGPGVLNFWSDLKKVTTKWSNQNDSNWMS